ncbi:YceI family protein [Tenacibaculum caenipelagi]|uniref:YceI-like domain-containing protein n=1 Tax=Tenacibaculum caenipelagi TaxID=1325435 RepID=A0A4R6T9M6_9FLAO|nr:YceI family protein [Tenacibaculum caenipelagi]TDQ21913.1 YceI-like domain-containing protein [Tenacibaculum caenipelagi]
MKSLFIILLFLSQNIFCQKYYTRTGNTEFKASVDAFEPVEAENKSTTVILNTENGEIASLLLIKAFRFRLALMQEHFNENYMDSDEHPKATFAGKIHDFNMDEIVSEKEYKITGILNIRGINKKITTSAKIIKTGDQIFLKSNFSVKPQDFNIKIPSIVRNKIAKSVIITIDYELSEKK